MAGRMYPIQWDFRLGVRFEQAAVLGREEELPGLILDFYRGHPPRDLAAAAHALVAFYQGWMHEEKREDTPEGNEKGGRWYDYSADADVLSASFLIAYGIDLNQNDLHWWQFKRLMLALPEDSPFKQRVMYRVVPVKDVPKDRRKYWRKMQARYAIHDPGAPKTAEERDAALLAWADKVYADAKKKMREK